MDKNDLVYGRNSVEGILASSKRNINKIYLQKGIKYDEKIKKIVDLAKTNNIIIQEVPKEKLNMMAGENHQGIAASVSPVEYIDFDDFLSSIQSKTNNAMVIILDGVEDPHNLGSIIRTSVAAGADAIIIPRRRSSPVTPTVEKASAGAIDKIPIIQVTNLNKAIEKLKENHFWVIGAESSGEKYYFDIEYNDMNCAIITGGENQGISQLVKKNCDFLVKIPMPGNINSLNVANATSILIYEVIRQRIKQNANIKS